MTPNLSVYCLLIALGPPTAVCTEQQARGDGDDLDSSKTTVLVVSFFATCISCLAIAILCSQCWLIKRIRRGDHQLTDDEADTTDNGVQQRRGDEMVQMNVRDLELDPIVFEPLPTLVNIEYEGRQNDQSPRLSKDGRNLRNSLPKTFRPTPSFDSSIYAHDWFDESFTNFPRGNLEYIEEIGYGWFGKVIKAYARDIVPFARKIRVVVKVLREDASGLEQMRFLDEARLYRDSTHGNILRLLGHSIEATPFLLILEDCPQGNLKSFLISNVSRAELLNRKGDVMRMAVDLARALSWMSSADFIHGDLAARNCLVSEGRVIVGDYGLSTSHFRDDYYWSSNGVVIPLRWAAPETIHCTMNTIQTLKVTKSANVWSFGVLLWEIATFCKQPYYELDDDEVISRVICDKNYSLGMPNMTSVKGQHLYEIMKRCWNPAPHERPPVTVLLVELESLHREIQATISDGEDFDSKWELLHPNAHSLSSQTPPQHGNHAKAVLPPPASAKKSVRFAEEVVHVPRFISATSNSAESNKEVVADAYGRETKEEKADFSKISEKVREKSQNYQNFLTLTHVDASELEDSIPYEANTSNTSLSTEESSASKAGESDSSKDSAIVLYGASEELGLDYYQQFTTEVVDPNFSNQIDVKSSSKNSASAPKVARVDNSEGHNDHVETEKAVPNEQSLSPCRGSSVPPGTNLEFENSFVPSTWNQRLVPSKPALKSPDNHEKRELSTTGVEIPISACNLKKSVSFESNKVHLYEYTPPPPASDSEEEDRSHRFIPLTKLVPISLDWDDSDTSIHPEPNYTSQSKKMNAVDFYRISGVESSPDSSPSHGEESTSTGAVKQDLDSNVVLGELRHKRDKLKLDLGGESQNKTIGDAKSTNQSGDSGMGSGSTSASPFK